ncbi:MAG: nitrogenase component 1 [Treponema sp.]|nr:nitrogenase component 1 [Treponema sp.]
MCNCPTFEKTLQYVSPAHGGWGVIRVAALIPDSHMLFVCPFACGRHGALGGHINGIKDRIHYLYIDESDIVSGNYENLIPDAVDELFEFLEKRPKVLFIFVSCLDDLLGTDHEALNAGLSQIYPDVNFITAHMNPFKMDTKIPPMVGLQLSMYSLFNKNLPKLNQINMIGNNAYIKKDCELYSLMESADYKICHVGLCQEFEEFLEMQKSKLNLILHPCAKMAAQKMEREAGIPFQMGLNTYDPEEIEGYYHQLEENLGIKLPDFSEKKKKAIEAIKKTKEVLGDYPVVLDYQSVLKPFSLAKVLVEYGFNVKMIFCDGVLEFEKEKCQWLLEKIPDLKIIPALHPDGIKFENKLEECLCIGFTGGYLTKSIHVVDQMEDEHLYGFWGVEQLMDKILYAFSHTTDVNKIIAGAKLIV